VPGFGSHSRACRDSCVEPLIVLQDRTIKIVNFSVLWGLRNKLEQNHMFRIGASEKEWPDSRHNSEDPSEPKSEAFDFAPYHVDRPHIRWENLREFSTFYGVMQAEAFHMGIEIRCGADWDRDGDQYDQTFNDLGHIELVI
jgi:hypothetical protein